MVSEATAGNHSSRAVTRRAVLRRSAVAATGAAAFVRRASAQITRTGVVPSPERWADENLAGFLIHVGPEPSPESPATPPECEFEDWPPGEISRYNATLVNRKQDDTPEEDTTLFVDADVTVAPGQLYLISSFGRCESRYVGLALEQIGRTDVAGGEGGPVVDVEEDEQPNTETADGTGVVGPGFGTLTALAGAAGLGGWLAKRRRG